MKMEIKDLSAEERQQQEVETVFWQGVLPVLCGCCKASLPSKRRESKIKIDDPVVPVQWEMKVQEGKNMKKSRRWAALGLVAVMSLGLLAGCGGNEGSDEGGGAERDTITVATMAEPPTLSHVEHNATAGYYVNLLNFTGLMRLGDDLEPVPDLAESYEAVSDTEWVFKLRQDVKFHDGTDMTAEDVKASLDYAKNFPEVSLYNDNIQSVEVVDEYTVKITTPTPSPVLLFNLTQHANAVVPKKLIDEGHDFNTDPVGTGPYKFVSWTRGDQLEFEAFEDYYLGEPAIKHIIWKIIPEGSSRTIALEAGEVDLVIEVESMDVDRIKGNDALATVEYYPTSVTWVMLNNEIAPMDNQAFRHAINSAIDKESVVTVALNGLGAPALAQMPTNIPGVTEENADEYDVEQAKAYLQESGIDPSTVTFSIICSDDTKKRAGEVVQANLKEIGIECTLESMDLATYLSATAEGNFVAAIGGYGMSDTISYFNGVFHSKSINASNKSRLNNPEVDALIDEASQTIDKEQREALTTECAALLNELCSQAPLYQTLSLRAFNADLQGVTVNANGDLRIEDISWK